MNATSTRSLDLRGIPDGAQLAAAAVAMLELRPGELGQAEQRVRPG